MTHSAKFDLFKGNYIELSRPRLTISNKNSYFYYDDADGCCSCTPTPIDENSDVAN